MTADKEMPLKTVCCSFCPNTSEDKEATRKLFKGAEGAICNVCLKDLADLSQPEIVTVEDICHDLQVEILGVTPDGNSLEQSDFADKQVNRGLVWLAEKYPNGLKVVKDKE